MPILIQGMSAELYVLENVNMWPCETFFPAATHMVIYTVIYLRLARLFFILFYTATILFLNRKN